jgi:tetratricopeptide (TPR) repeat protein
MGQFEAKFTAKPLPIATQTWGGYGQQLYSGKHYKKSPSAFRSAAGLNPRNGSQHEELGNCLLRDGQALEAERALRTAWDQGRRSLALCVQLAGLGCKRNDFSEAEKWARLAVETAPTSGIARMWLGWALAHQAKPSDWDTHFKKALELDPDHPTILTTFGSALQLAGRFDEAIQMFQNSIAREPRQSTPYLGLFNSGTVTDSLRPHVDQAEALLQTGAPPPEDSLRLHFAVAKANDDLREYDKAMQHFDEAHRISSRLLAHTPFDRRWYRSAIDDVIRTCNADLLRAADEIGNPTEQPIFILGVMRSGTTLVEQIVSSHSEVDGVGEEGFFHDGPVRSNSLRGFSPTVLKVAADRYLDKLNRLAPGAAKITDKMPANYLSAGFIHAAFPKAKIILVRRDPCSTCLSIWTTANRTPLNWSHRKEDIVFVFREYERLLRHWRSFIPAANLLEIEYESLVHSSERTIREMIQFCGLPWDGACLLHERNFRPIMTPSVWQARQPIYSSSLRRQDNYAGLLGAFAQLL